ncbi:hypothetical protein [Azospirillum sp. TSA6c]|uniref:hypothetical protein n=1 Tax=Azospirillum sp. TSA6c TaxID=709813 RepID=UPI0011B6F6D7|nr:hypothetical protein [Azospirillum sp. TSA6c]
MRSVVRGVAGLPYPAVRFGPGRSGWVDGDAVAKPTEAPARGLLGGLPAVVGPLLGASVLGALILHLMASLVAQLPAADALGALSVMVGMAVVLVTLLPFALLSFRRAQRAWAAIQDFGQETGQGAGRP